MKKRFFKEKKLVFFFLKEKKKKKFFFFKKFINIFKRLLNKLRKHESLGYFPNSFFLSLAFYCFFPDWLFSNHP